MYINVIVCLSVNGEDEEEKGGGERGERVMRKN